MEVLVKQGPGEGAVPPGSVPGQAEAGGRHRNGQEQKHQAWERGGIPSVIDAGGFQTCVKPLEEALPQPAVPDGIRGRFQQVAEPDEDADLADEQAEDGSHFHNDAGEPHAGGPHDVLDDSLFGRAEDGGLHGKDAEPQDGPVQIVDAQAPVHARQHAYLEQGHELDDARLAETVRKPADEWGEQDEGQHDDGPQRIFQVPLCAVQPDAQGNQQELSPFFIKGVLRLNQHEPPESSPWNFAGVSWRMGAGIHEVTGWAPPLFPGRSRGTGTARR